MKKCSRCGYIGDSKFCPECGNAMQSTFETDELVVSVDENKQEVKNKKSKKFIISGIIMILLIGVFAIVFTRFGGNEVRKDLVWEEIILGYAIPKPQSMSGSVDVNDADYLSIDVENTSYGEYKAYVDACIELGYDAISKSDLNSYTAINKDGYELSLYYHESEKEMEITMDVLVEGTIQWSNSDLARLLPIPNSTRGTICSDYEEGYSAYLGGISETEYDSYIEECEVKGFSYDVQKQENVFYAKNNRGYELSVEYKGYDIIYIELDVPEEVVDEEMNEESAEEKNVDTNVDNSKTDESSNASENNSEEDTSTSKEDTDTSLKILTDSEINDLAVVTLYKQLVAYEDKYKNIDAESCKYNINTIEHEDGQVYVYGVVYFYDKHGSVTKFGDDYQRNFTVSMTKYGDVPWCKFE